MARPRGIVKDLEDEFWLPIPDTNNEYFASNKYRVKAVKYGSHKLKCITIQKNLYCRIRVSVNGKSWDLLYHRILCILFKPNPNNYPCVNHKDNNPSNYLLDNLEWCTYSYNSKYSVAQGRSALLPFTTSQRKLTDEQVLSIYNDKRGANVLAEEFAVKPATIKGIRKGRAWKRITGWVSNPKGNGHSTLTNEDVLSILKDESNLESIGKKYSVSKSTIHYIKVGKSWSWLTGVKYKKEKLCVQ